MQVQQAEARRRIAEFEAEAETVRLTRIEEGLRNNPLAAERQIESAQLEVAARALAANIRAVLQVSGPTILLAIRDARCAAERRPPARQHYR